jgi:hypothetical protein
MPNSNEELDELAQKAIEEILRDREASERVNVAAVAREYKVSRYRVDRRLKGIGSRSSRKSAYKKLIDV